MGATIVPTFQCVECIFCFHEGSVHNYMTNIDSDVEIIKFTHASLELKV